MLRHACSFYILLLSSKNCQKISCNSPKIYLQAKFKKVIAFVLMHIKHIYTHIIVKQLSKANPTKNRHRQNVQKLVENAVATPATNPIKLQPANAGMRPYRSAIHPKRSPPTMAPMKKMAWEYVGNLSLSQTQLS